MSGEVRAWITAAADEFARSERELVDRLPWDMTRDEALVWSALRRLATCGCPGTDDVVEELDRVRAVTL